MVSDIVNDCCSLNHFLGSWDSLFTGFFAFFISPIVIASIWTIFEGFPSIPYFDTRSKTTRFKVYFSVIFGRITFVGAGLLAIASLVSALQGKKDGIIGAIVVLFFMLPTALLAFAYQAHGGIRPLRQYIKCQRCDWYGGLSDLRYNGGRCPSCGSEVFCVPELLSTYKIGETIKGLMPTVITKYYRHTYRIKSVRLRDIQNMPKIVWKGVPVKWWDESSQSK